uniref:Uncharacterized protein n=1 Tax=Equus caballus TaxID=9796 RepID=A0A9L0R5U0_HORSE
MSLLQSALDFLAGPGSLGGAAGRDQTDFVGQTVELGELRLRVRRVLAEGPHCCWSRPSLTSFNFDYLPPDPVTLQVGLQHMMSGHMAESVTQRSGCSASSPAI